MCEFIWDKVRKILPWALFLAACGVFCYALMKHAGEDTAALVGLAAIGIAVFLVGYMVCCALRDVLRWRRDFTLAAAMDEFREAEVIHVNVRAGRERLFFNTVALEYSAIRSMLCSRELISTLHGEANWWFILHAVRTDGKAFKVLLIMEKTVPGTRDEAVALFTRVMDIVARHNHQANLRYPSF